MREAWRHIPELANVEYMSGWHIEFLCAHLEAITWGQFRSAGLENRLLANVPPGTMKSLLICVFWPAWEWAYGFAHYQYLTTSFREDNCTRDTRRHRDLCISDWYVSLYGKDWFDGDRPCKGVVLVAKGEERISNTAGGWRQGMPFGSLTNQRGDRLIIDDPHSMDTAESDADRATTTQRFRNSATSRLNDPVNSAIVVIMQRLHVNDLSGVIEQLRLTYVKVMLPMRFEIDRRCVTPIGRDPRQHDGELLFPARFPIEVVDRDEAAMTDYAVAGQYQQRPYLRIGSMFQRGWFETVRAVPSEVSRCRGWDLAATKKKKINSAGGPAFSAGVRMSKGQAIFYVEHVVRFRGTPAEVKSTIKNMASTDPDGTRVSVPQDPGQAGVAQRDDYAAALVGSDIRFSPESGEKEDRAAPLSAQAEVGNVKIVKTGDPTRDAWIEPFLDEICQFPAGRYKDQTDAASRAFAELLKMAKVSGGDIGGAPSQVDPSRGEAAEG